MRRKASTSMHRRYYFRAAAALCAVAAQYAPSPPAELSCSLETVRQPWDSVEPPAVFYADQNCPNDVTGLVDDSAIWQALPVREFSSADASSNSSSVLNDAETHHANKTIGALARPAGLMVAGGDLLWLEQDAGVLKRCPVALDGGPSGCRGSPETLLSALNCPQDFAMDFVHNAIYVLQFGGGHGEEAALMCGGEGRITRFPRFTAADNTSFASDVVTGLLAPRFLALDPLFDDSTTGGTGGGLLFWSDPGHLGGSIMRANSDGSGVTQLFHLAEPSGIAVDDQRQALYVTQQVRGASLVWSSYDGAWQKHITREFYYEPRGLAVDPTDGSVAIIEFDTFARGCDPLDRGGYGAVACSERNLGRVSRISCAWTADTTIDGRPPAPFQCCCAVPGPNHWGCTLECVPPAPPPPFSPPSPPNPPPLPPGFSRVNVSEAIPPRPIRDYTRMIIDDETMLFAGGYVTTGTQAVSWGDPTTITLVSASRVAPPPPPGAWPVPRSGTLYYGNCTPGCGRPTGVDDCVPCGSGFYGSGDGICRMCPPGRGGAALRASDINTACAPCALGSYTPHWGSTSCLTCPMGTFCADGYALSEYGLLQAAPLNGGIPMPVLCPVGTYNPYEGSTSPADCVACPPGTYNHYPGGITNASCIPCSPGTSSGEAASHCPPCRKSTAQSEYGAATCPDCPPGSYSAEDGMTHCSLCPVGTFNPLYGEVGPCRDCGAGTFAMEEGQDSCTLCPNGTISTALAAKSNLTCTRCAGATYSLLKGSTECTPCPENIGSLTQPGGGRGGGSSAAEELPEFVLQLCADELNSAAPSSRRAGLSGVATAAVAAAIGVLAVASSACWRGERL